MIERAVKGWHFKARQMWRSGASEHDIAQRFQVSRGAVQYALRIVKVAERGLGRRPRSLSQANGTVHDQLDCVEMMSAIERGQSGAFGLLKRYAGGF